MPGGREIGKKVIGFLSGPYPEFGSSEGFEKALMTFERCRRLPIPVRRGPFEQLSKISLSPATTLTAREQSLPTNVPRQIQPDQGGRSWNCHFSKPTVHAFDDPPLCRGEAGNLLPSRIFAFLGSNPVVFPVDQVEIKNWCANQLANSFGKAALARAAVANDECAECQGFGFKHSNGTVAVG